MTRGARPDKKLMTIWVAGMTCKACERRISNAPKTLPGVIPATASTRKGTAGLIATNQASRVTVDKTITAPGYGLGRSG